MAFGHASTLSFRSSTTIIVVVFGILLVLAATMASSVEQQQPMVTYAVHLAPNANANSVAQRHGYVVCINDDALQQQSTGWLIACAVVVGGDAIAW
jgi:hypothetical protein